MGTGMQTVLTTTERSKAPNAMLGKKYVNKNVMMNDQPVVYYRKAQGVVVRDRNDMKISRTFQSAFD